MVFRDTASSLNLAPGILAPFLHQNVKPVQFSVCTFSVSQQSSCQYVCLILFVHLIKVCFLYKIHHMSVCLLNSAHLFVCM